MSDFVRPPLLDLSDDFGERAEQKWEEECVKQVLQRFKLLPVRFDLIEQQFRSTGMRALTFYQFSRRYPSFPIYFVSAVLRNLRKKCPLDRLLLDLKTRPIVTEYEKRREMIPPELVGMPYALLVKWPYMTPAMCVHSYSSDLDYGPKLMYKLKRHIYCVEPLPQLLRQIGWQP